MQGIRHDVAAVVAAALAVAGLATSCSNGNPAAHNAPQPVTMTAVQSACRSFGVGDPKAQCGQGGAPKLLGNVELAIDLLIEQSPQLFDLHNTSAPNTTYYKVLDENGYLDGVVANLKREGACAQRNPQDPVFEQIQVKNSTDRSETYDILTQDGYIRRGQGSFVDACSPAAFPIERAPETPPDGSSCGAPYPPPVSKMNCTVHLKGGDFDTLDSTPLVGPDVEYCAAIGYYDGRAFCPVRQEGAPDRVACEAWRVGTAADTGRPGPTWTRADGSFCSGPESGCQNSPDNQYQLWAYVGGQYQVKAATGGPCIVTSGR